MEYIGTLWGSFVEGINGMSDCVVSLEMATFFVFLFIILPKRHI